MLLLKFDLMYKNKLKGLNFYCAFHIAIKIVQNCKIKYSKYYITLLPLLELH